MALDATKLFQCVRAGAWGVAVSGGADSVALVHLLRHHADLSLTVIHLDHETRAGDSARDAAFVATLARQLGLPLAAATLSDVERELLSRGPLSNASARYRAARYAWFGKVAREGSLNGVLLAHHADDQAETVLLRLVRGGDITGLTGMQQSTRLGDLEVLRPLLGVRRAALRDYLVERNLDWCEDASNDSNVYRRSVARRVLARHPAIFEPLIAVASSATAWRKWVRDVAPTLEDVFPTALLGTLSRPLALEASRRWLVARGVPVDELSAEVCDRLVQMARDAASPARTHFPGPLLVRRRRGLISAEGAR